MNFSFFTVFLNKRNIISKIKRSKVTDYAALTPGHTFNVIIISLQMLKSHLFRQRDNAMLF